jgi:multimeric flavodoxin WrbA
MKVIMINGSPHKNGNTFTALNEISMTLEKENIQTEIFNIGTKPMQGCIACQKCVETGVCVFHDDLYDAVVESAKTADGLIVGTPVYYAGPNGALCAFLDRLFYSASELLEYKPAAAVVVCRRGGASAAFDRLNKYFSINNMPIVTSQYWNIVYGRLPGEASRDAEGLQTMRTLARNMAWMLKSLSEDKPEAEEQQVTNFIR